MRAVCARRRAVLRGTEAMGPSRGPGSVLATAALGRRGRQMGKGQGGPTSFLRAQSISAHCPSEARVFLAADAAAARAVLVDCSPVSTLSMASPRGVP